jgi:F-box interacting protein
MSASKVLHDPIWEIYSLKSNSWKKLDLDMKKIYRSPVSVVEQVYMNGVCHWLGKSERDIDNFYLVSFDLGNEGFFLTSIPSIMYNIIDFELVNTHLLLLNESIALIYKDVETTTFHISILGEIGVRESWTKLFIIGPFPGLGNPIGVGKNGDIFFAKEDEELARCDLTTNTVQELGIKNMFFCCQMVIYKKNLLSIEE